MNDSQTGEKINNFFSNVGANLASMVPECNPAINHPPREDMNVNVLMFEDIIEEEVENLYKKFCIYKSSGINNISSRIWKTVYHNFYNQIVNDGI